MRARVAQPDNMERHATSPVSYVLALDNSKHQLLHNYIAITELCSNILKTSAILSCPKTYMVSCNN